VSVKTVTPAEWYQLNRSIGISQNKRNKNADGSDNPQGRQQNRRVEITVEKPPTAK
jgi:flagellar motor protein MotB